MDQDQPLLENIVNTGSGRAKFVYGVLLASLSGILFTANNFIINQTEVDVGDVVLVRTIVQCLVYVPVILYREDSFLPASNTHKRFTILQGLCSSITFICGLACVAFMDVPDALSIIFACPLVTIVLSALMLNDKLNSVKVVAVFLLLSGVVLVCKPPFLFKTHILDLDPEQTDDKFAVGVVLAITSCLAGGTMDVLVAKCEEVSTAVLLFWTAFIGFLMTVTYGLVYPGSAILSSNVVNIPARDWLLFLGLAVSGLLAFSTLTRSLQLISPNLVASLRTLELPLSFRVQSLLTGESPGLLSLLGGGLILTGVLMIALQHQLLATLERIKADLNRGSYPDYSYRKMKVYA